MIRLIYSNRFEALADDLADRVAARRGGELRALFEPITIIVPSQDVADHVRLRVARRCGIAANLELPFLESLLARAAPAGVRVLQREQLRAAIIGVLDDRELLRDPELGPVRAYLDAAGDDPDARDLRRVQLAGEVAGLITDYAVARPELLSSWPAGPQHTGDDWAPIEAWQRRLYLAALAALGRAEPEVRWTTLPELYTGDVELDLPRQLSLIGFSLLPPGYRPILHRLAHECDLEVYALNPCREFWEDVQSSAEERRHRRRGAPALAEGFDARPDNRALRLWGQPGRESIRLYDELADFDFDDRFAEPTAERDTVLARLQRDILHRADAPADAARAHDGSVQVLSCPNVRREIEIIGNEIAALIRADPTLRFNDIAILVARGERELYQAQVASVFGELGHIPHHLLDLPLASDSRLVEAFDHLLELPLGQFSRPEMLRVLTHPTILARFPDVDPTDWVHWTERLGIVHGADDSDHAGTYLHGSGCFHWEQGLRRLALGAMMAGARSGTDDLVRFGNLEYRPEELGGSDLVSAARLALLARSLVADARFAAKKRLRLSEWRRYFDALASSYLVARDGADERALSRCHDAIAGLADSDVGGAEVGYRVASELLRARLAGLRGSRGEPLGQGVSIAPLQPMRPLPYRVLFVAGLGEGAFPTPTRESPLDLRLASPRAGDIKPRDRDRYAFLEVLLSARERLYLSHVGRDERTGEELAPSPVVLELLDMLRAYVHDADTVRVRHPLRRHDERYHPALFAPAGVAGDLPSLAPAARRQAQAVALRRGLVRQAADSGAAAPEPHELRAALQAPDLRPVREHLRIPELPDAPPPVEPDVELSVSLSVLRRFLESPLQAWAQAVLGLREDPDDVASREDEPFELGGLDAAILIRGVMGEALRAGDDLDRLIRRYQRHLHLARAGSRAPAGVFSDIQQRQHREALRRWHEILAPHAGDWRAVSFGRAREHETVDDSRESIHLTVELEGAGPVRVELYGRTELLSPELGSVMFTLGAKAKERYRVRAFVDQLALCAGRVAPDRPHGGLILATDRNDRIRLGAMSRERARSHLALLIGELFGQHHEYLLPFEIVHAARGKGDYAQRVDKIKDRAFGTADHYGAVSGIDRLSAPPDAEAIVERRFGPFFERLEEVRG